MWPQTSILAREFVHSNDAAEDAETNADFASLRRHRSAPFGWKSFPTTNGHEFTRMTEERSLPCCTVLGARTVSALDSACRSFVSIRVHSWLDRLFPYATCGRAGPIWIGDAPRCAHALPVVR